MGFNSGFKGLIHTGYAECLLAGSRRSILILLASSHHNLYDIYLYICYVYSARLLMMDRKPVRNM